MKTGRDCIKQPKLRYPRRKRKWFKCLKGGHFRKPVRKREFDFQKKYKTELCNNWIKNSNCVLGKKVIFRFCYVNPVKCRFAHGKKELRKKKYLSKNYKTMPCKSFHLKHYCSYGQRCQYLHSEITLVTKGNLNYFTPNLRLKSLSNDFSYYSRLEQLVS